jgi:hypothetical protein
VQSIFALVAQPEVVHGFRENVQSVFAHVAQTPKAHGFREKVVELEGKINPWTVSDKTPPHLSITRILIDPLSTFRERSHYMFSEVKRKKMEVRT